MTPLLSTALILLALLQVKHLFADFFLQSQRMLMDRGVYLHIGRVQHVALHAVFSAAVFLVIGAPPFFVLWLCVLEAIVHFHIDFAKGRYSDNKGHGPKDAGYWRAFGADQLLHQLTYVAMVAAWGNAVEAASF